MRSRRTPSPTLVGRYPVFGVLGSGATGTALLGTDPDTGQRVVLKRVDTTDPGVADRIRAEVGAMRSLSDPHCVSVLDVVDEPPDLAIVMPYVEAAPLRDVLARSERLDGAEALGVLRGALRGLVAVHAAGLVHGDVKPANILIDRSGKAMLIDFGLTRAAGVASGAGRAEGSPAYMSPEQIRGEAVDARSDIYATGAVLFELLTGQRPYPAVAVADVLVHHLQAPVPDPGEVGAGVSDALSQVCMTAMAKNPTDRYPTAQTFLDALEDAARRRYGAAWATGAGAGAIVAALLETDLRPPSRHATARLNPAGKGWSRRRRRAAIAGSVTGLAALIAVIATIVATSPGSPAKQHTAAAVQRPTPSSAAGLSTSSATTSSATPQVVPCTAPALQALLPAPYPGDVVRSTSTFGLRDLLRQFSLNPSKDRVVFSRAGFRCGTHRFAQSPTRGETVYLYQVRDAASARRLLDAQRQEIGALHGTSFAVPSIPGAFGGTTRQTKPGSAPFWENDVLFACGRFAVQVGFGYSSRTAPTDAIGLAEAARSALTSHC